MHQCLNGDDQVVCPSYCAGNCRKGPRWQNLEVCLQSLWRHGGSWLSCMQRSCRSPIEVSLGVGNVQNPCIGKFACQRTSQTNANRRLLSESPILRWIMVVLIGACSCRSITELSGRKFCIFIDVESFVFHGISSWMHNSFFSSLHAPRISFSSFYGL